MNNCDRLDVSVVSLGSSDYVSVAVERRSYPAFNPQAVMTTRGSDIESGRSSNDWTPQAAQRIEASAGVRADARMRALAEQGPMVP